MQVSVISTPKARNARIARISSAAIAELWPSRRYTAKSIPRGSVYGGHPDPPFGLGGGGEVFEKAHPGLAERFGVGHQVRLRHSHEIGSIEEFADGDLVGDRPTPRLAEFARQHRAFFSCQPH